MYIDKIDIIELNTKGLLRQYICERSEGKHMKSHVDTYIQNIT